jgi:hypothetical protein
MSLQAIICFLAMFCFLKISHLTDGLQKMDCNGALLLLLEFDEVPFCLFDQ